MRSRVLLSNTMANAASSIFGQALAFVTLPMLLKQVGLGDYGMYALATSALGYFSIFSLMARTSVVKYISEYREGRENEIGSLFNSAIAVNTMMGLLIGVILFLLGYFCEDIFRIEAADVPRARLLLYLHAGATVLLQPLTVYGSLLYGLQRYGVIALIDALWALVRTAVILAIYFFDGSIFWLAWEEILCQLLKFIILALYIRSQYPFVRLNPAAANRADLKKIAFYGAWSLLYTASLLVVSQGSMLLIGILLSVGMITYFQIAYKLYNLINTISLYINSAVVPASSSAIAGGDKSFIETLAFRGTRLNMVVILCLASNIIIFSDDIIRYWLGSEYVEGVSGVCRILIMSWLFTAHSIMITQIYWGQKDIAGLSIASFFGGVLQILLTFFFIDSMGLSGVAITHMFFYAFLAIVGVWLGGRTFGISLKKLSLAALPVYPILAVYLVFVLLVLHFIGEPRDLFQLLLTFTISVGFGFVICMLAVARNEVKKAASIGRRFFVSNASGQYIKIVGKRLNTDGR